MIFRNLLSHNNILAENISINEVKSFADAVGNLNKALQCKSCDNYLVYDQDLEIIRCSNPRCQSPFQVKTKRHWLKRINITLYYHPIINCKSKVCEFNNRVPRLCVVVGHTKLNLVQFTPEECNPVMKDITSREDMAAHGKVLGAWWRPIIGSSSPITRRSTSKATFPW
jgi:hypothetical protein